MSSGSIHSGDGDSAPSLRLVGEATGSWAQATRQPPTTRPIADTRRVPGPAVRKRLAPPRPEPGPEPSAFEKPRGPVAARVAATMEAADPRWVLAIRVAEGLEGTTLSPEKRRSLIRMGKVFGLTAFDANLIIAIVQDQARRGYRPEVCPRMGEAQLQMVPLPHRAKLLSLGATPARRWTTIALLITCMAAVELAVLWLVFGA